MVKDSETYSKEKRYSYADYLAWDEEAKYELINGKLFDMSPAPNRDHQKVSMNIIRLLLDFYTKRGCDLYHAPFDVRFPETKKGGDKETYTVVQPDICVFCDLSKLDDKGAIGAPDLIVEILSPATAQKDLQDKYKLYEAHKVPTYWIVHPEEKLLEVFKLNDKNQYLLDKYYTVNDEMVLDEGHTFTVEKLFS
jgi:Uma2 family endonuclease